MSNRTVNLSVWQDPGHAIGSEQNRYFDNGEVLKKNLIYNLTDQEKYMVYWKHLFHIALIPLLNCLSIDVIPPVNLIIKYLSTIKYSV